MDKQDAYRMLSRLSGKEHSVFTGVAIVHCCTKDGQLDTEVSEFYEETTVKFSELSEEMLWEYIDSGEPMDKAGGYGIQALGGMLVEYVRGDFLNVVGFPLNRFCKELAHLYHGPRAHGAPRQVQHDSIPAVDTFEDLSDAEGGGSDPARANEGLEPCGRSRRLPPREADLNGVTDSQPPLPVGLLELMDGFKASKALLTACKLQVFDVLKERGPWRPRTSPAKSAPRWAAPRACLTSVRPWACWTSRTEVTATRRWPACTWRRTASSLSTAWPPTTTGPSGAPSRTWAGLCERGQRGPQSPCRRPPTSGARRRPCSS